jgi:hypothetical protein
MPAGRTHPSPRRPIGRPSTACLAPRSAQFRKTPLFSRLFLEEAAENLAGFGLTVDHMVGPFGHPPAGSLLYQRLMPFAVHHGVYRCRADQVGQVGFDDRIVGEQRRRLNCPYRRRVPSCLSNDGWRADPPPTGAGSPALPPGPFEVAPFRGQLPQSFVEDVRAKGGRVVCAKGAEFGLDPGPLPSLASRCSQLSELVRRRLFEA